MKEQQDKTNLAYLTIPDTPLGNIHCSANERGLVALAFYAPEKAARTAGVIPDSLLQLREEIFAYFKGRKGDFTTAVDLSGLSAFQRDVLNACREIPYGMVKTYGALASMVGKPGAAQAVGGALARNPIPLVIPCHRVLSAGGRLHGYSAAGGLETKQYLLALEGAVLFDQPLSEG